MIKFEVYKKNYVEKNADDLKVSNEKEYNAILKRIDNEQSILFKEKSYYENDKVKLEIVRKKIAFLYEWRNKIHKNFRKR